MSVTQLKPFNPIWGETFQAKIGDTNVYLEQTSHHPPIYHFYVNIFIIISKLEKILNHLDINDQKHQQVQIRLLLLH